MELLADFLSLGRGSVKQDQHYGVEFTIRSCELEKPPLETMRITVMTANEQITLLVFKI